MRVQRKTLLLLAAPFIVLIGAGYIHWAVAMARHWHFLSVLFWVGNGVIFMILLFATGQWRRLVPDSWQIVPDAWTVGHRVRRQHSYGWRGGGGYNEDHEYFGELANI